MTAETTDIADLDGTTPDTSVYAAGVVMWHGTGDERRVLVIHRGRHDDFSLPKGKVDPGETLPETAVREAREETGFDVTLGASLGYIEYDIPDGRHKEVHYWCAEIAQEDVDRHAFEPNDEVDSLEWVGLDRAASMLSYDLDREVLRRFVDRCERGLERTFAIIVLRHAKAVPPLSWPGDDSSRPITARGQEQAEQVTPVLEAFGPARIITSSAVRCRATIAPFATRSGILPIVSPAISQSAYDDGTDAIDEVVADVIAQRQTTVLCSHSPVMPEILREIAGATSTPTRQIMRLSMLSTGECTVLHVSTDDPERGVVASESHGPLV